MSPDNSQAGPSRSKAPAKVYRSLSDTEESDFEDNPPLRVPFTDAPQLSHTKKTLQTGGRTREPSAKRSKIACGKPTDRHPTCRIIHDITQNEDWKIHLDEVQKGLKSSRISDGLRTRLGRRLRRLTQPEAIWGVVERSQENQAAGPCLRCTHQDVDCIVQLDVSDSGQRITSTCLTCYMCEKSCELFTPPEGRRMPDIPPPDPSKAKLPKKILSKVDPLDSIPAPRGPKTSLPQKTNIKRLAPHPTASPPPAKVPKPTLQTEKLGAASGPSKSPVATLLPLHGRRASTISPKQALAAVDDLDEFRASMYEIMVAKNQMNFQTKGMFYMVEQQINNIRKYAENDQRCREGD